MIRNKYNPNLRYYQLGELVLNCSKVNYKLNYKPGLLICPRTKENVKFDDVKDRLIHYSKLPIAFKRQNLQHCELVDMPYGQLTENEKLEEILKPRLENYPFLYQDNQMLLVAHL